MRWACDVLRPVYEASAWVDGRVSFTASGNELFEQLDAELHTKRAAA